MYSQSSLLDLTVGHVHDYKWSHHNEEKYQTKDETVPVPGGLAPHWSITVASVPINGWHWEQMLRSWFSVFSLDIDPLKCNGNDWRLLSSSGSSGRVRGGPRNMKSMRPPSAAIFFMTYFHIAGGGHGPLGPPGSATAFNGFMSDWSFTGHAKSFLIITWQTEASLPLWLLVQVDSTPGLPRDPVSAD